MATAKKIGIRIYPPLDSTLRAFIAKTCEVALPYLERNRKIVDNSDMLLAAPAGPEAEHLRSGTWSTIRYAIKMGKRVFIILPDGEEEYR